MIRLLFRFVLMFLICAPAAVAGPAPSQQPALLAYDEFADASRDVRAAVAQARAEGKLVMLVFGANWCPDCRAFDEEMNAADLGSLLALNYAVVKIDVGRFKKNLDVAARYGAPVRKGIPSVVLVNGEDKTVMVVDGPKMEELRHDGRARVVKYFEATLSADKRAWLIQQQEKLDKQKSQGPLEYLRSKLN